MNVLFCGIECYPFIKLGGLGDVMGSLPKELNSLGVNARVILPKFATINEDLVNDLELVESFFVFIATKANKVNLYQKEFDGTIYYFLECDKYFNRDKVLGFPDDSERLALYQIGVIESLKYFGDFKVDVINCHDYHTGMIPQLIKTKYYKEFGHIKTVFTIHNAMNQGEFDRQTAKIFNIPFDNIMNQNGKMNFTKSAILSADYVNTVSESYGRELLSSDYFAMGLSDCLNQKRKKSAFFGILNGIDYKYYNPETDMYLPFKYNLSNYKEGKIEAKNALYNKLGVDFFNDVPLIGMVTKLTKHKGLDLIIKSIEGLMEKSLFKMVLVGKGDKEYEDFFIDLEKRHPYKFKCYLDYNEEIAHLVYSASDFILMPSAFEPCGLGQMIALKYGTIPIVRETGGLRDSVESYNKETKIGNGFRFHGFHHNEMNDAIYEALETFNDKEEFNNLISNAMNSNYSFRVSAIKYYKMYKRLLQNQ